jgi:hypothetical protein
MGYEATDTNRTTLKPVWDFATNIDFNIADNATIAADSYNGGFYIAGMVYDYYEDKIKVKSFSIDNLLNAKSVGINRNTILESFSANALSSVSGNFSFSQNSKAKSFKCPNLVYCGAAADVTQCNELTEVRIDSLTTINNNLSVSFNPKLVTLNIKKLTSVKILSVRNNPLLTSFHQSIPYLDYANEFQFQDNAFTATVVNELLGMAVQIGNSSGVVWGRGRYFNISGGTNAAPTGNGITAAQTLIARGCTVTVNGTPITTTKKNNLPIPEFDTVADKGKTLKVKADGTGLEWVA